MVLSVGKRHLIEKVSKKDGIISALAFDQRGALKRMMTEYQTGQVLRKDIEVLKKIVSEELTPHASSILLDPEYGLPAIQVKDKDTGLLLAYEKTGYDTTSVARMPDCLEDWSVKRLKEKGADAVKFLLYYDIDGDELINQRKQAYIERIGSECKAEDIPFFLEILTYDENISDNNSPEFARLKPDKVNGAMRIFSKERFGVDILKVEVPVNMSFVEGFSEEVVVISQNEAREAFAQQEASTSLPYIYLSAGVSSKLFQETLVFAKESGAKFSGVLCGRATWAGSVPVFVEKGEVETREWLKTEGVKNISNLNNLLKNLATPWFEKILES